MFGFRKFFDVITRTPHVQRGDHSLKLFAVAKSYLDPPDKTVYTLAPPPHFDPPDKTGK